MIKPTVGRVVHYWPAVPPMEQPWPAIVVYVHHDRDVNLAVFDELGFLRARQHVQLLQDDDTPRGECCAWMPFQKGQAMKTEALEAKLAPGALGMTNILGRD